MNQACAHSKKFVHFRLQGQLKNLEYFTNLTDKLSCSSMNVSTQSIVNSTAVLAAVTGIYLSPFSLRVMKTF